MTWHLRQATAADSAEIQELIARSIRALGAGDYSTEQIEGALKGAFGLDSQLISDGTFFVVEGDGRLIGCGGWSYRRTLFGGDAGSVGTPERSIRGPTRPRSARSSSIPRRPGRGIGTALLERCEDEARRYGFRRAEMMATLPGKKLYETRGYVPGEKVHYPVGPGVSIEFVPMSKSLTA